MSTLKSNRHDYSLYRMYDQDECLLYIGVSSRVMTRLGEHWHTKSWVPEISKITIEKYKTRSALEDAESIAIRLEKPKHNIAMSKFVERPSVIIRKRRQRLFFSTALSNYVNSTGKTWFDCAYELGVHHTAISRWKNAKFCPGPKMLKKIEIWSDGFLKESDFEIRNFEYEIDADSNEELNLEGDNDPAP